MRRAQNVYLIEARYAKGPYSNQGVKIGPVVRRLVKNAGPFRSAEAAMNSAAWFRALEVSLSCHAIRFVRATRGKRKKRRKLRA